MALPSSALQHLNRSRGKKRKFPDDLRYTKNQLRLVVRLGGAVSQSFKPVLLKRACEVFSYRLFLSVASLFMKTAAKKTFHTYEALDGFSSSIAEELQPYHLSFP